MIRFSLVFWTGNDANSHVKDIHILRSILEVMMLFFGESTQVGGEPEDQELWN